ncbi:site-specific DNA-methyltransferase [Accumulibacter sp.]|uniref:site-specific DNA-methyltransferase n=1 Tax=Accumulibacter sp. TaxID=2053492 RepID=UPI001A39E4BB|nr:site-specific DNA-methyltransferase [Accumulibacter sp.]MBL8374910.1 site-specific DNA-methyltransferase [Accumulibacter sp.]
MLNKKETAAAAPAHAGDSIASIKYPAKRKNIPPAGLEAQGVVQQAPKIRYEYNPHLPPMLRSATDAATADKLPKLLAIARQRALSAEEAEVLADALRRHEPWLEWSGKREKPWFEVEPVALHMHERISTQAILRVLAREDVERDLFADPQHDYAKAVQFYQHDVDWANRMILGDSLQVMASLARREDLAGKVQMIYLDPPYGIKFASNFQPQLGQRDVKDREQDLTREPEMVKAYRDTWTLGIHSYLAYLRDRLEMAKELLADSGSIFVQISDENLHRVRCVMDDVFKAENFAGQIAFKKTGGFETIGLPGICDYLLWYAKDKTKAKFVTLYDEKIHGEGSGDRYNSVMLSDGSVVPVSRFQIDEGLQLPKDVRLFLGGPLTSDGAVKEPKRFEFEGESFLHKPNQHWKTTTEGLGRLGKSERIFRTKEFLNSRIFLNDFAATPITNMWTDTMGTAEREKVYVVQTATKIIERCILMTTDPGDLVLDPTCGSGTTAYVAEQWGRRWITCDSSRVALALAKHRLLTAKFDYHQLRPLNAEDVARNPIGTWLTDPTGKVPGKATFACKTMPHITLKSIARNTSLDPIFAKYEPILAEKLTQLNGEVATVGTALKAKLVEKLIHKHRESGANAVTDADTRRWLLPDTQAALIRSFPARSPLKGLTARQADAYRAAIPKNEGGGWKEWQVPFGTDPDWPPSLQEALTAYRAAWRAKMDEVNACIAANAEMEELVDKPEPVKGVVRVSGPFSMEGVIAVEDGPDTPIGGVPDDLDAFDGDAAVSNAEAHLDKIIRLLKASGVDFSGNRNMKFSRLDPLTGAALIHAEGEWMNGDQKERRVAVSVGPEIGNVSAMQVEDVIRDANRKGYDDLVFAGFGFDAAAQDAIESASHPKLRLHMALIRPDVAMGDLLKSQPGSQLFTVFSAPRVKGPTPHADGEFTVEVEGMDVYDPVSNTLFPTDKARIAAWFLDTDYDGRTFCICQAFFPDKSKWAKLAKALGNAGVIEEEAFAALSGLKSLPFPRPARLGKGETWRVAVKVIDPRGNEGMRVLQFSERY